jgi:beta-lactamase regulating signal transducer with metallopeptidase domain
MSTIQQLVLDWLFNASVQIGLFAILAAVLSRFIAKAKATYQYCFYLAIFTLCLTAPVFNTLWQTPPSVAAQRSQQQPIQGIEHPDHRLWGWDWNSKAYALVILAPSAKTALFLVWEVFFLYRLIHFSRGIYRVHRLRKGALLISPSEIGMADSPIEPPHHVVLLESTAIDDPVTVGVLHPAIILPSKVIPALDQPDLTAILAHEYGHIRRKDYLVHLLCQLTALPGTPAFST